MNIKTMEVYLLVSVFDCSEIELGSAGITRVLQDSILVRKTHEKMINIVLRK